MSGSENWWENERATADLLELTKRSIHLGDTDEDILEQMIAVGLARRSYTRHVNELIEQARRETRVPDPSNAAAVAEAQPFKMMNLRELDDEQPPTREWAVRHRIPARQVTLFSGEGGVGKSIITMQFLVATALARDWLGSLPEGGPVIYLNAEDEEDELHRRLHAILTHYDETFEELTINGFHIGSLAGEDATLVRFDHSNRIEPTLRFDRLMEMACDIHPAVIALDTLSDIYGGNEIDRVQVSAFLGLMRKLAMQSGSAVIINAHPSLAGINSGSGLSGSTAWHGKVRGRMYLRADKEDPELRVLEFLKNQYGKLDDSVRLRYQNGVFVPEPTMGSLDQKAAERRIDDLFLKLLIRFTEQRRNVSHKPGTSYAPTLFAEEAEAKAAKCTKDVLKDAMTRLLAANQIHVEGYGPPSRRDTQQRLVAGPRL
jgi:RecA-family ATPase